MDFFIIVALWAGLTMCFLRRLQVILINLGNMIAWRKAGMGLITYPVIASSRPAKQVLIWMAELWMLMFFYSAFGISIMAHVTAAICGVGVMIALREKDAASLLEGMQLVPMNESAPEAVAA